MGIRPQQPTIPTSQIAQDLLGQTQIIYQDVRKNAMQAFIKYKAYYSKDANASKLKEADNVYVLQSKANHQESKIPFTVFRWIGPYFTEKVLPNNNYLVRKIGISKTHVLHSMQMCQFTPRQLIPDVRISPQEWKPDPEVSLKHDDLYAKAWECEHENPFSDNENDNAMPPNSLKIAVRSDPSSEEKQTTRETAQECSQKIIPQTEELCDVTDRYPYMEFAAETSSE